MLLPNRPLRFSSSSRHTIPGRPGFQSGPPPQLPARSNPNFLAYKTHFLSPTFSLVLFRHASPIRTRTSTAAAGVRERNKRGGGTGIFTGGVEREIEGSNSSKMMMGAMVDNYVVGTLLASLLGSFVLFHILRRKTTAEKDEIRNDCVRSSTNGEVRPEGGPENDVVIVGAGVAGAALAHTLGKVRSCFLLSFSFFPYFFCTGFCLENNHANQEQI